ncbi:MAG: hypothetical protein DWH84_04605 [Planctomycetota bacterium]|nr:MAG: hypothetical protein DWH84_04605 [Planctomycetota bacterium]
MRLVRTKGAGLRPTGSDALTFLTERDEELQNTSGSSATGIENRVLRPELAALTENVTHRDSKRWFKGTGVTLGCVSLPLGV